MCVRRSWEAVRFPSLVFINHVKTQCPFCHFVRKNPVDLHFFTILCPVLVDFGVFFLDDTRKVTIFAAEIKLLPL